MTKLDLPPTPTDKELPTASELKLVAVDMDGTLLDAAGNLPPGVAGVIAGLAERGIMFVPASGRQYWSVERLFAGIADDLMILADNGSLVQQAGRQISSAEIGQPVAAQAAWRVRDYSRQDASAGLIVSGLNAAYAERDDPAFLAAAAPYYARLEVVPDLTEVRDQVLKLALYTDGRASASVEPTLGAFADDFDVVISGADWVDMMQLGVGKGSALAALQAATGASAQETVAFGDFMNDAGLLDNAYYAFAMENATPDLFPHARFRAPSNANYGVVKVLRRILDKQAPRGNSGVVAEKREAGR